MMRKKLNNKGFTLVELLAVIIILAIVVGITVPVVLTTTSSTKSKAFVTAADTVADWVDRQYQVYSSGLNDSGVATLDSNFSSGCFPTTGISCTDISGVTFSSSDSDQKKFIQASGVKANNVSSINVKIDSSTGRSCVTLTAAAGGDYANSTSGGNTQTGGSCS